MQEVRALHEPSTQLQTALSTLSLSLGRDHFTPSGRLKVRCTASLYSLYWQITENSAELERARAAVVAASNAVDVRDVWRESDKLVGQLQTFSFIYLPHDICLLYINLDTYTASFYKNIEV